MLDPRGCGQAGRPGKSAQCWCPAQRPPKLVTNSTVAHMKSGRCFWSTSPLTRVAASRIRAPPPHDDPTFAVHDTLFYCVANMPGAVPRTSTYALTNATHAVCAEAGRQALAGPPARADPALAKGLSTHDGAPALRAGGSRPRPWPCHQSGHRAGLTSYPQEPGHRASGARVCPSIGVVHSNDRDSPDSPPTIIAINVLSVNKPVELGKLHRRRGNGGSASVRPR